MRPSGVRRLRRIQPLIAVAASVSPTTVNVHGAR